MRRATTIACILALAFLQGSTLAQEHNRGEADMADIAPSLSWILEQGFRMGYNNDAPLDWYERAAQCGMNGIITRLEIANNPDGDELVNDNYPAEGSMPGAVRSWRMVQPSSRLAKQHGLHFFYMLNLGASRSNINDGLRDNPRRHNNGKLFSPLDEIYWQRVVENRFLRVADMLQGEEYQIDGFLIDPEMYSEQGAQPGGVDYGDYALSEFVKETGVQIDYEGLSIDQRRELIRDKGLDEKLYEFEFERIRGLAQGTREKLQAKVPDAIMGTFLWRDLLWFKALAAGFSTPRVPCWIGPESTYPGAFDEQFLNYQDQVRAQAGVPIFFCPGLRFGFEDGAVPTDFLQVLPGNLYERSINTQGYWFWALRRLGATDEERAPFIQVLRTVNSELDERAAAGEKYVSFLKAAPLPVLRPRNLQQMLTDVRGWRGLPAEAMPDDAPGAAGIALRNMYAYAFAVPAEEGDTLAFSVGNVQLGAYTAPTACAFYRPDGSRMAELPVPLGQTQRVEAKADRSGVWVVGITSHNNAFWVMPEVQSCVLATEDVFHLCKTRGPENLNRAFFYVPQGTEQFSVEMSASVAEPAGFRIFNPAGEMVCERDKLTGTATQQFEAGQFAGRVWWLETLDVAEDHGFRLQGIPNVVSVRADQLLVPEL